jgi:glycerol-3-phosphate dehydrogenase
MSASQYDLLIIGGGITGACVAWDASLRGLRVALVEKGDFGGATTSATSKLIHGGLRYLKNLEFGLVRESLRERKTLSLTAPHQIYPLPILCATYRKGPSRKRPLKVGMMLYDLLSLDKSWGGVPEEKRISSHRFLSREATLEAAPFLKQEGLTGSFLYYDCQNFFPERHCLSFIQSAAAQGATIANYAEAIELVISEHRIEGALVRDRISGAEHEIQATVTANVSGPWADHLLGLCKGVEERRVRRSKGIHIVTRALSPEYGVTVITGKRGHVFSLPWRGHSLIGITDTEFFGDPDDLKVKRKDIEDLLARVNRFFPGARLTVQEVRYAYAGLRPIVDQDVEIVYDASRRYEIYDHAKDEGIQGMVTVVGGKYTTSRHLAEQVVSMVTKKLKRPDPGCRTGRLPIYGGVIPGIRASTEDAIQRNPFGLPSATCEHLIRTYGTAYEELFTHPESSPEAGEPICDGQPDIQAQIDHAVEREMCLTLSDLLLRRTGIGTLGDPGQDCAQRCAEKMGGLLSWSPERVEKELEAFYEKIAVP